MKYQCSSCGDILESTPIDRFQICMCESVFVDGSFDNDGTQLLHRSGYLKEGAELIDVH